MDTLFSAEPIRPRAVRGQPALAMPRAKRDDIWPRRDRDPADVAVVASRLLVASGRINTRLRALARSHAVDPQLFRLLLLFAESNRPLRIGNVAELLGVSRTTAGRAATRAQAAGLIDKFATSIDGREVIVRITVSGRVAVTRCLDAIRADAAEVLGLARSATAHPRGADLKQLLGAPPSLHRTSENWGWRAGVRAGMPDE
jgi:DNA-binding MarR family transcriptional regulator